MKKFVYLLGILGVTASCIASLAHASLGDTINHAIEKSDEVMTSAHQMLMEKVGAGLDSTPTSYKKLYRSDRNRMIGGVCGGISEYLTIDPLIVRLAFAAATYLTGGAFLVIYAIAWLLMPREF